MGGRALAGTDFGRRVSWAPTEPRTAADASIPAGSVGGCGLGGSVGGRGLGDAATADVGGLLLARAARGRLFELADPRAIASAFASSSSCRATSSMPCGGARTLDRVQ